MSFYFLLAIGNFLLPPVVPPSCQYLFVYFSASFNACLFTENDPWRVCFLFEACFESITFSVWLFLA